VRNVPEQKERQRIILKSKEKDHKKII
jgi:hypothetical protein